MRRIVKDPVATGEFRKWAAKKKFKKFNEFSAGEYKAAYELTRAHILTVEQGGLSGYTEEPVDIGDKRIAHIDHYYCQALYPQKIFDYENFVVDYRYTPYGSSAKDNNVKANFNYASIFNPVTEDMSQYIDFAFDGKMQPKGGIDTATASRVDETIRVFDLNHELLTERRRAMLRELNNWKGFEASEIKSNFGPQGFPSLVEWWCDKFAI